MIYKVFIYLYRQSGDSRSNSTVDDKPIDKSSDQTDENISVVS